MAVESVGLGAGAVLAGLGALHVYWAFGGRRGQGAVVPTVDERPLISPSRTATLVVAMLLGVGALLVAGAALEWPPRLVFRAGGTGVGVVLLARAVGERRYLGFFKGERGTPFARRDTWVYSPLCLALGAAAVLAALAS